MQVHSTNIIRKELFKLFYNTGEFTLHAKADASETFDLILRLIHGWHTTQDDIPIYDAIEQSCNECFIH